MMTLNEYQDRAAETAGGLENALNLPGWVYCALALNEEAGEVAGKVKKAIRDDGGKVTPGRRTGILLELADTLWYLAMEARELNSSLEEVAMLGFAKIESRVARGTLHGEGDDR